MITTTSHPQDLTASTQTSTPKNAAALWSATIEALRAYQAECEVLDLSRDLDRESVERDG